MKMIMPFISRLFKPLEINTFEILSLCQFFLFFASEKPWNFEFGYIIAYQLTIVKNACNLVISVIVVENWKQLIIFLFGNESFCYPHTSFKHCCIPSNETCFIGDENARIVFM